MPSDPPIQRGKLIGLKPDVDGRSLASRRRTALFLWLHSVFCHKTVVPQVRAARKVRASAAALTSTPEFPDVTGWICSYGLERRSCCWPVPRPRARRALRLRLKAVPVFRAAGLDTLDGRDTNRTPVQKRTG
jgi:hypothetical protein